MEFATFIINAKLLNLVQVDLRHTVNSSRLASRGPFIFHLLLRVNMYLPSNVCLGSQVSRWGVSTHLQRFNV